MIVKITDDTIARSVSCDSELADGELYCARCVVGQSINNIIRPPFFAAAGLSDIFIYNRREDYGTNIVPYRLSLPSKITTLILDWDNHRPIKPCEFEVKGLEAYI